MSVASEITRINQNISAAYAACAGRGAALPQTQNSAGLAAAVNSIGDAPAVGKDINLYDYNGTLLYGYTFAEAAALTALPALPVHSGLTAQGWNCTLNQVKAFARNGRQLNVGATYITSDGSTKLYLFVAKGTKIPNLQIHMKLSANQTVTVNWGDGTTSSLSNPGSAEAFVCAEKTDYAEAAQDTVLCVRLIGGSFQLGYDGNYSLFGEGCEPTLLKAELGANCGGILPYAFQKTSLKELLLSPRVGLIAEYAFFSCFNLKAVVLPGCVVGLDSYAFGSCTELSVISIPETVYNIGTYAFNACSNLNTIVLPTSLLTSIKNNALRSCRNLQYVRIPWTVESILAGAFNGCSKLYKFDLTEFDDPENLPALGNTNTFANTSEFLRFIVANQEMKTAFSAAANWSAYASQFTVG